MNFKAYDILSSLIPGFLILLVLQEFLYEPFNKDWIVPYTAIAFLLGNVMNTISSWMEDIYFFTWGGKPSSCLLEGKSIWKVKFYHHVKAKTELLTDCGDSRAKSDKLFSIAMRVANCTKDNRVEDFNAQYAFSRVLLTTTLLSTIFLLYQHHNEWKYYAISLPIVWILWLRCKQRGYYYAKEVLEVYLKSKST